MLKENYKNKKVFITGSTGFKGSWLAYWLYTLGADVYGYSLEPITNPSLYCILNLEKKITHFYDDINNLDKLKNTIYTVEPDILFHLAAQPIVGRSYLEPIETFQTNVMGTANVMEAIRGCKSIKAAVIVSSDKCYKNNNWNFSYREIDPLGGYDPYSASKGCTEIVASSFRDSFFNPRDYGKNHHVSIATARSGNVVGGGDWSEDRLVPDCFRSLNNNESIILRNPKAVRPWQHVLDANHGYLQLGLSLLKNGTRDAEAWNFGPNTDQIHPVSTIVEYIQRKIKKGNIEFAKKSYHEAALLSLDISKSVSRLNWKPKLNLEDTLDWTINWYQSFFDKSYDLEKLTNEQINQFQKL